MAMNRKKIERICELSDQGWSIDRIAEETGVSPGSVEYQIKVSRKNWLQEHWHFTREPKTPRIRRRGKYRVVYVGDHTNFRTPYRKDGIWH